MGMSEAERASKKTLLIFEFEISSTDRIKWNSIMTE